MSDKDRGECCIISKPHSQRLNKEMDTEGASNQSRQNDVECLSSCENEDHRAPSMLINFLAHISYGILTLFGFLRDFMRKHGLEKTLGAMESADMMDFVPLYASFESFYTRNIYLRMSDCMSRPIMSVAGATIDIAKRVYHNSGWTIEHTGEVQEDVLNLGSYNYLGFAENEGSCCEDAISSITRYGVGVCSSRLEMGNLDLHETLEKAVADYLGMEDCLTFGMGFATNSMNIPCLVSKGCLILSDELNHASLILGCRLSGACIKVFKHNDMVDLEFKLRESIVNGQPRKHTPWKKILIVAEGVYSMEGSVINLPGLVSLKRKYNVYLYIDEAHSIGALGKTGRGITQHFGIDPNNVDLLMGTFTKSFAAAGGYIAGKKEVIAHVRNHSHASCYAVSMSPPVAQQIISALKKMDDPSDGHKRIQRLRVNSQLFRSELKQRGFIVCGHKESPIVPIMVYMPSKLSPFSREMLRRGCAIVVAGFPAVPLNESRVRFCISSAHTTGQLRQALGVIDDVGSVMGLKYQKKAWK